MFTYTKCKQQRIRKAGNKKILRRLQHFLDENEKDLTAALTIALTFNSDIISDDAIKSIMNRGKVEDSNLLPVIAAGDAVTPMAEAFENNKVQRVYERSLDYGVEHVNTDLNIKVPESPRGRNNSNIPLLPSPAQPELLPAPSFHYEDAYNEWCSENCGELIREISEGQRQNVQRIINDAMQNGRSYQDAAREIRRTVGLTKHQLDINCRYRDKVYEQILSDNPNMQIGTAWKRAEEAANRYAQKQRHERAKTIARTEIAKAQMNASLQYIRWQQAKGLLGPVHGEWITSGRENVCDICLSLNRKVVDLEKDPLPPLHPRCACCIKFVEGEAESEIAELRNVSLNDYAQYQRYVNILGKDSIGTVDNFVDIKYNNSEMWKFIQLDYKRQSRLIRHPELQLPNAKQATADDRKFTGYLFNPENAAGWAKGKAFTSRLGYEKNNYKELQESILKSAEKYPSKFKDHDKFGDKYEQKIVLYGHNGTPANVVIGWKANAGKTWMTSAYIKEVKN